MKHRLRDEKVCLNCGTEITDRYCPHCGQENLDPKESFGHLVLDFVSDITHYDSKLLITLKDLLFKPGFLSREYFAGRRTRYLNPVRMYAFISVVFFFVLFLKKDETGASPNHPGQKQSNIVTFKIGKDNYRSVHEYDSIQQRLSADKKDKGLRRWLQRTNVSLKDRYGERTQEVLSEIFEHNLPKLMFVLLPLFALFVFIFYSRRKYSYAEHVIFALHFHSFIFLLFLFILILRWIPGAHTLASILSGLSFFILLFYFIAALRNCYRQSAGLSVIKALAIGLLYFIALLAGIAGLGFISFVAA